MFLLPFLAAVALPGPGLAYHNGAADTHCWLGPNYASLLDPCPVAKVDFLAKPSSGEVLFTDTPFAVTAQVTLLLPYELTSSGKGFLVPHANVHMCRVEMGWCTPNINVQPLLATQSPEVQSDSLVLTVADLVLPVAGDWTVVAHFTFNASNRQQLGSMRQYDFAAGFRQRVKQEYVRESAADWSVALCQCLAGVGMGLSLASLGVVVWKRNHWVFKSSTPSMSVLMCVGCLVAFAAVFTLPPLDWENNTSHFVCNARVWLLSLAFDFVLVPFALRTWRVYKLFAVAGFHRKVITDLMLVRCGAALVLLDVGFCLVWTLVWPLKLSRVPFQSNPNVVYSMQCAGSNQLALEVVAYLFHGLPLLWLARVGSKVRRSFQLRQQQQRHSSTAHSASNPTTSNNDLAKLSFFDESEAISQTLVSLGGVSLFSIALQYTVRDSPTSVLLMVALGVVWSAYFTLFVNFLPRFVNLVLYEKDGVTRKEQLQST